MLRTAVISTASLVVLTATAYAAPDLVRLRGTIESSTDSAITIKMMDGKTQMIEIAPDTKFASVVSSNLGEVKDGKFIGTATKGENPPTALEVVVFPASMNGTAEGHYAWDSIPDSTSSNAMTKSSMTNGTIKSSGGAMTKSSMTNGTVKSGSAMGGSKKITVTFDGGKSLDIVVPPTAPIVALEPSDKSIVKTGAKLFAVTAKAGGKLDGKLVLIGKDGVTPPM